MPTMAAASSTWLMRGRYQPLLSKHSTKLSRYRLSGTIHRKGTEATFWVMWLLMASSMAEPAPASASHIRRADQRGAGLLGASAAAAWPASEVLREAMAQAAHSSTKPAKPIDQPRAWVRVLIHGSTANG